MVTLTDNSTPILELYFEMPVALAFVFTYGSTARCMGAKCLDGEMREEGEEGWGNEGGGRGRMGK